MSQPDSTQELDALVQALRGLLEESVACVRRGNLSRLEELGEQAGGIVEKMRQGRDNLPAALGTRGGSLQQLYAELASMLRAEQADAYDKLKRLRQVRRAVGAYRTDR